MQGLYWVSAPSSRAVPGVPGVVSGAATWVDTRCATPRTMALVALHYPPPQEGCHSQEGSPAPRPPWRETNAGSGPIPVEHGGPPPSSSRPPPHGPRPHPQLVASRPRALRWCPSDKRRSPRRQRSGGSTWTPRGGGRRVGPPGPEPPRCLPPRPTQGGPSDPPRQGATRGGRPPGVAATTAAAAPTGRGKAETGPAAVPAAGPGTGKSLVALCLGGSRRSERRRRRQRRTGR